MLKLLTSILCLVLAGQVLISQEIDPVPGDQEEPRPFQLSLFPFIGTEGVYAQHNTYRFSVNIFAGMTGGVDGLELGGFVNINRYGVKGLQGGGFANVNGGGLQGAQFAGFANISNDNSKGLQASGFAGIVNGDADIMQASGFASVVNGSFTGIQVSGFASVINGVSEGVQVSGFASVNGNRHKGVQASGFANAANSIEGVQVAGFVNIAERAEGLQAAGFVNVAEHIKGLQLGFINVADSIDGLPIGFISVVRHDGYRKFELSGGDAMNLSAGFKIGVSKFYNLLTLGTQFTGEKSVFTYGYGIGSEFMLSNNKYLTVEAVSHQIPEQDWWKYERMNMLNQLRIGYATDISERVQFFAGPVINVQVRLKDSDGETGIDIAPYKMFEFSGRKAETAIWAGINTGIRFW